MCGTLYTLMLMLFSVAIRDPPACNRVVASILDNSARLDVKVQCRGTALRIYESAAEAESRSPLGLFGERR